MKIRLTKREIAKATTVAKKRHAMNRKSKRPDKTAKSMGVGKADLVGALGEAAVAKALELEWDGAFFEEKEWQKWRDEGHDVSGFEVRASTHPKGRLTMHNRDADHKKFIFVLLDELPHATLKGWIFGHEGKEQKYWWRGPYNMPCYYVPISQLRSIEDLEKASKGPNKSSKGSKKA